MPPSPLARNHLLPPWADNAACLGADPETFYPEKGGTTREAKVICKGCPVAAACLDYALEMGERFGVWGGASERERHRLNSNLAPLPRFAECGTDAGYSAHIRAGEPTCARCRSAHRVAQLQRRAS